MVIVIHRDAANFGHISPEKAPIITHSITDIGELIHASQPHRYGIFFVSSGWRRVCTGIRAVAL
jgi:hypothetical protein